MINNSGLTKTELATELLKRLSPLGFRMAVRFASYPGVDPEALEVDMFRIPDDRVVTVGKSAWEIVINTEEELGFTSTLVATLGEDVSEEYEATLTASAIASWRPEVPYSPSIAAGA